MTIFLFSLWTLTFISIAVVFAALLLLYGMYSLLSFLFLKLERRNVAGTSPEVAAAIALALEMEKDGIVHDKEPGFITINTDCGRGWNDKSLCLRKTL